jgi:signal transduction histidine kinase
VKHNTTHLKKSLHRYLNQRYLAILILLIILFTAMIFFIRFSAMDDTTDYYMHYDAQVLSEYYKIADDIVEFDVGRKEYYWGKNRLPKRYQNLIGIQSEPMTLVINKTQLYQMADKFIYILPYYSVAKDEIFFVLHLFDIKSEVMFYQSWQNNFILLVTLLLLFVIFYSLHTNRQISQQMEDFTVWIQSMSCLKYQALRQQTQPKTLSFTELISSGNYLHSSLITQYELQKKEQISLTREKHFLSCLSHELRTPIAIMSAALTLLNKSEKIIAKDKEKLIKLHKAHLNMKQLTNTLLQLWRGQQGVKLGQIKVFNKIFLLDELVENSMSFCQQQFLRKDISFALKITGNTKLFAQVELADILISNLLQNSCQYSGNGKVNV